MAGFESIINSSLVLTEGSVIERLNHEFNLTLNQELLNAELVSSSHAGRAILENIYKEYIGIAREFNLPVLILTPTWKVNMKSCHDSIDKLRRTIRECCQFIYDLKKEYGYGNIYIGGLMGVRNDSYSPDLSLPVEDSYDFHKFTVAEFMNNQDSIDFLIASTLPGVTEAHGMAAAMSESGKPYVLSFVMRDNGELLDGIPVSDAIGLIDNNVTNKPVGYMLNCVHPQNALAGLNSLVKALPGEKVKYLERLIGIQGNTSLLPPEQLDCSSGTHRDGFDLFIDSMSGLRKAYGFTVLGGCCGSNGSHIRAIAALSSE